MDNEIILSANNPQGQLSEYAEWLENIKSQYRNAQLKAAVKVNSELLRFYWKLGHDLVTLKAEERWGAGIIERISLDFKEAFPRQSGFSKTNLWTLRNGMPFILSLTHPLYFISQPSHLNRRKWHIQGVNYLYRK